MNPNAFFIVISFIVVLALLLIVLLKLPNKKNKETIVVDNSIIDFDSVMMLLDSEYSTTEDLQRAKEYFFNYYHKWDLSKMQKKSFLVALCLHPKTNSKLILSAERKLGEKNPKLKKDFEKIVKQALEFR